MNKSRILFLAANPAGSQLQLDVESRAIEQKIRSTDHRDSLELVTKWAVRPDDLLEYLNEYRPHVVHFSGHGTEEEQIILVDDSHRAIPVSSAALKQLFTTLKDNIRVVLLNACYSQDQAEAIVEVIDCAIGMKQEIGDEASIAFAASFYRAVGYGHSVNDAFEQGKVALMLQGIPEETTPTLLVREGIDADALFLVDIDEVDVVQPSQETTDRVEQAAPEGSQRAAAPEVSQSASLNDVLPGTWQVQIQGGWGTAQMQLEVFPTAQFRGQLTTPMGMFSVDGSWHADPFTQQITLQGRQSNGFQVIPYGAMVQVTFFDPQQIVGVTNAGEQVSWQRIG
jgi:CHAT domain-containing protein